MTLSRADLSNAALDMSVYADDLTKYALNVSNVITVLTCLEFRTLQSRGIVR